MIMWLFGLYQDLDAKAKTMVERGGFEPPKAEPADLQSAPFDRSGTSPVSPYVEPAKGIEPPTH
jgi:hypothetical protein